MFRLRFLPILIILLFSPLITVLGQVQVVKSTEKVVIEGKVFYLHTVLKGQTAFSIAKAYGITVDDLTKANPSAASGTKEGEKLKIPAKQSTTTKPQSQTQSLPADVISKGMIYHYMASGETVYSLSRKHNVKEEDILRSNPGLNINDISVGTRIAIPVSPSAQKTVVEKEQTVTQTHTADEQKTEDGKSLYHKVLKGETLSSLSREYNVSLRDLKKANKGLLFPKEGDYVMIPLQTNGSGVRQPEESIATVETKNLEKLADTITDPEIESVENQNASLNNLKGSIRVAVLLPFFLDEAYQMSAYDSSYYDVPFLEMYEGILVAADSLRSLGLKIELSVFDTGDDTLVVQQLISSGKLDNADLILGPVYSSSLEDVAVYASSREIPVVSPVSLRDQNILTGKPSLFKICPSYSVEQNVVANYVAGIPNANVIMLYSDSLMYDPKTISFRNKLTRVFWDRDSISGFKEFYFSGRLIKKSNIYKDAKALEEQLVKDKENVIILSTNDLTKVSAALSVLHNLSKKYNIRVTGSSELRDGYETIDLKYFFDLKMMLPYENYIDFSRPEVRGFVKNYYNRFKTEPEEANFAWRGFDMAYYFIAATARYGKSFYKRFDDFTPPLTSYDFRFGRIMENDGFENQNMFIIEYNHDRTITVTSFRDLVKHEEYGKR